jgi:hypothetical protein
MESLAYHGLLICFLFADEQTGGNAAGREAGTGSEEEGLSGAEDVSLLLQEVRRETAGKGYKKREMGKYLSTRLLMNSFSN